MRNIKLVIEYEGTNYCGWQSQKNVISIQDTIQDAIFKITGSRVELIGSGRTDGGVHALGQVANFIIDSEIKAERFAFALNWILPHDIVIKNSCEVDMDFHSRYCAVGKQYSYLLLNSRQPTALYRNLAHHISYCDKLDVSKMEDASKYFIGTYDFSSFMSKGSSIKSTVRTIYDVKIVQNEEFIKIIYHGNGFLYNMVRIISGTLLQTAIGKIEPINIPDIIQSKNRQRAGIGLPAHGVYLEKVYY